MHVTHVIEALESIAPLEGAAEWDNVGLLIGSGTWPADVVMLTIDLTEAVLMEAVEAGAQMVVSYHPPIFEPLRALTDRTPKESIVLEAAHRGIAVHSPHTALDAAPGGVNDWIAAGLGAGDVRSLEVHPSLPESQQCKLVTFCPAEAVDQLRKALAAIGAGRIGPYELCSFEIAGTGTFLGGPGTSPAVGRSGRLERVDEIRLEMVCPAASLALAVTTLRLCHPYEEPPIEIYGLQPRPERGRGHGRKIVLDAKVPLRTLIERAKQRLGVDRLRVAVSPKAPRQYGTIGLCAGAGGGLLESAIDQGCELFLTGEMRHHDVLAARSRGCTIMLAGHTNTERGYLKVLRRRLAKALPSISVSVSRRDGNPLVER